MKKLLYFLLVLAILASAVLPVQWQVGNWEMGAGEANASGENWLLSNGTAYGTGDPFVHRREIGITAAVPQAQDTTTTINSYADTTVFQWAPTTNYGTGTYMLLYDLASFVFRDLLKFSTSTIPDTGYTISSATLSVNLYAYEGALDAAKEIKCKRVTSSWTETGVTWNTQPTVTDTDQATATTVHATTGWVDFNVLALVQDAMANRSDILDVRLSFTTETGGTSEPYFATREYAVDITKRPKLVVVLVNTPTVPTNYKVPINIHRGSKTVESGNWTINSAECHERIAFTVHTHNALAATYPLKVLVDTKTLITGGFFDGSTAAYAKDVEWGNSTSDTVGMKYWVTEAGAATPDNFNTSGTIYYIELPSGLTADTDHTMYMYIRHDQSGNSTNYDAENTFSFFEHFDTNVNNLTEFLGNYTEWETDPNAAVVSVASSVLTLDSVNVDQWDAIATKTGSFTIQNFRMLARVSSAIGTQTAIGMWDSAGIGAAGDKSGVIHYLYGDTKWIINYNNGATLLEDNLLTAPYLVDTGKYGGYYTHLVQRDSADTDSRVDTRAWSDFTDLLANDEVHKVVVGSFGTNDIDIDWVAVMPEIEEPPYVAFPDILYDKAGTVFLDNNCQHWPYDIAFTDNDGNTTLKRWDDPLTELTRQPGDSMQATVRVTDSLASNQDIYVYYGHSSITSTQADHDPEDTYDTFEDFEAVGEWTVKAGSWAVTDVMNPVMYRGEVGNIGGQGGRVWAREASVVKWGTNDYRMALTNLLWEEEMLSWPATYRVFTAESSTPTGVFSPAQQMFSDGKYEHLNWGYWQDSLRVYPTGPGNASRAYELYPVVDGCKVTYSDDFETWTINPNGPFITAQWLKDNGGAEFNGGDFVFSHCLLYENSIWYDFFSGIGVYGGAEHGHTGYAYIHESPENWTTALWHYGDWLIDSTDWLEDSDMITDGTYWFWTFTSGTSPELRYYRIPVGDFPGVGTSSWTYMGSLNPVTPPFGIAKRSQRFLQDGSDLYMYFSCAGVVEAGDDINTQWIPNWVVVNKAEATGFPGNWTAQNTEKKYKQATTTGVNIAYITASSITDGEIISEAQLGSAATNRAVGIVFRYEDTANNGYGAQLDYNTGNPKVSLFRIDAGAYTTLGTDYDIPQFPEPWLYPGYPWRLRVQLYGNIIKVAYSAWGNEWVETHSVTDNTYLTAGHVGVETSTAEGYHNNFRVRGFTLTEPVVGQADPVDYGFEITTLAATSVQSASATLNGNVTDVASAPWVGFVYGDNDAGDPGDVAPSASGWDGYVVTNADTPYEQGETFSLSTTLGNLTPLTVETCYIFRAWGNSSSGVNDYGEALWFCPQKDWDVNDGDVVVAGSTHSTSLSWGNLTNCGNVTVDVTIQGTDLCYGGYCWYLNNSGTPSAGNYSLIAGLYGGEGNITEYPDAHPETTTIDGDVRSDYYDVNGFDTWAELRDGDVGTNTYTSAYEMIVSFEVETTAGGVSTWPFLTRSMILFDTSAIPVGATITSANITLWGYLDGLDEGSFGTKVNIYSANPGNNTNLTADDYIYTEYGIMPFSTSLTVSDIAEDASYQFVLNYDGISNISKGGVSKFSLREELYDVGNITPPVPLSCYDKMCSVYAQFYTREGSQHFAGNSSKAPKLTVSYYTSPIIVKSTSPNYLIQGLAAGNSTQWGMAFYAPTSYTNPSSGNQLSGNVTLTAEAS